MSYSTVSSVIDSWEEIRRIPKCTWSCRRGRQSSVLWWVILNLRFAVSFVLVYFRRRRKDWSYALYKAVSICIDREGLEPLGCSFQSIYPIWQNNCLLLLSLRRTDIEFLQVRTWARSKGHFRLSERCRCISRAGKSTSFHKARQVLHPGRLDATTYDTPWVIFSMILTEIVVWQRRIRLTRTSPFCLYFSILSFYLL